MGFLTAIAPQWALRRAQARDLLRLYDAAQTPKKWNSWQRRQTSARAEVARGQRQVADAARDLVRNNGYAIRALSTLCRATVGTGITGSLLTGAGTRADDRAIEVWDNWREECDLDRHHDLYGLQLLAVRTMYESGGALIRFHPVPRESMPGLPPVRIQVLEEDFIDISRDEALRDGGYIDRGIEYDARGVKQAIWILPMHPGDYSRYLRGRFESERVPVGEIEHLFEKLRPGQDRGVSVFAGAVAPLQDLASYFDAELMRKKVEACLSVFVTSPDGPEMPLGLEPEEDGIGLSTRLAPGMIHHLQPGETVETLAPKGAGDVQMFAEQILFLAAAAGGVMFEHMTGNMKYVNYSSYRVGSYDFAGAIEQRQQLTIRPRLCMPMGRAFLGAALPLGLVPPRARVRWTPPPAITSPDPEKDARADLLEMGMGVKAPSEIVERRGRTYAGTLDRIRADREAAEALGLRFNTGVDGPETREDEKEDENGDKKAI